MARSEPCGRPLESLGRDRARARYRHGSHRGGAAGYVIEPARPWPNRTMRLHRRGEMSRQPSATAHVPFNTGADNQQRSGVLTGPAPSEMPIPSPSLPDKNGPMALRRARWIAAGVGRKPGSDRSLAMVLSEAELPGTGWRLLDQRTWRTGESDPSSGWAWRA